MRNLKNFNGTAVGQAPFFNQLKFLKSDPIGYLKK